jgi:hypothetical protein
MSLHSKRFVGEDCYGGAEIFSGYRLMPPPAGFENMTVGLVSAETCRKCAPQQQAAESLGINLELSD